MDIENIYSISAIKMLMREYHIAPKKRWGQNFLIDKNHACKIIDMLPIHSARIPRIWEVGAGFGALTALLQARNLHPLLFEIDYGLIAYLSNQWHNIEVISEYRGQALATGTSHLLCGDAVKIIPMLCTNNHTPNILVGNLPYNSAARLLMQCTQYNMAPDVIAVMVQKEIAQRVLSAPGSKNYSSFSVLMQLTYEHSAHWNVPRTVFYPSPNVDSTFLMLSRKERVDSYPIHQIESVVRCAFRSRRATLHKNFMHSTKHASTYKAALNATEHTFISNIRIMRAEEITPLQFLHLTRLLYPQNI